VAASLVASANTKLSLFDEAERQKWTSNITNGSERGCKSEVKLRARGMDDEGGYIAYRFINHGGSINRLPRAKDLIGYAAAVFLGYCT
jgi:hypothetical protein